MTEEELAAEKAVKGRRTTVDTLFGDGAMSYIRSRVTEMQSGEIGEEVDFKQTEWGKNNEMFGVEEFSYVTGLSVNYHGIASPIFYPYGDFAGGSPDGEVTGESAGIELKCPFNEDIHTRRLLIKTLDEFKEQEYETWHQCQMNMFIMKKDFWYACSFDPRKKERKLRLKIVKMTQCPEWVEDFKIRHEKAIEIMADILFETDKHLFVG